MSRLLGWIADAYAMLAAAPFLIFGFVWAAAYAIGRDRRKALRAAMDASVVLLAGAVYGLSGIVFGGTGLFFALMLVLLSLYGLVGNAQMRASGRVRHNRALRFVWRVGFLLLAPTYVILMCAGLWKYAP